MHETSFTTFVEMYTISAMFQKKVLVKLIPLRHSGFFGKSERDDVQFDCVVFMRQNFQMIKTVQILLQQYPFDKRCVFSTPPLWKLIHLFFFVSCQLFDDVLENVAIFNFRCCVPLSVPHQVPTNGI